MPSSFRKLLLVGLVLFWACEFQPQAAAQTVRAAPVRTQSLRQMTRSSGYIFSGEVTAVEQETATRPSSVATVRITFRVERGIRESIADKRSRSVSGRDSGSLASTTVLVNLLCYFSIHPANWD